jgi:threonine synthase
VLVPAGLVSASKLSQTIASGARIITVRGDFDDCLRLAREAEDRGSYLVNSVNPFRIEGQKSIVFEMLQQLDWTAPDWLVMPAGNLGNASAFGKALRECLALGLVLRVPRLLLVQAEGAAPFEASFRADFRRRDPVKATTIASAIRIGNPASFTRAARAVRETSGHVIAVSDAEILDSKWAIDKAGVGCEPASAASLAGVRKAVSAGVIAPGEIVVAVLTGHLLKHPVIEDATLSAGSENRGRRRAAEQIEIGVSTDELLAAIARGAADDRNHDAHQALPTS